MTCGLFAWHVHHMRLCERLTEPLEVRQAYIRDHKKPAAEVATRLRLLKVVADQEAVAPARRAFDEAVAPARRAFDEAVAPAHARECPDCPWDGLTIFPRLDGLDGAA